MIPDDVNIPSDDTADDFDGLRSMHIPFKKDEKQIFNWFPRGPVHRHAIQTPVVGIESSSCYVKHIYDVQLLLPGPGSIRAGMTKARKDRIKLLTQRQSHFQGQKNSESK